MKNETLNKAQAAVEAKLPPAMKSQYERILLAGMKVLFSKETHDKVFTRVGEGNVAARCAIVTASVLSMLFKESKGSMPMAAAMPAGVMIYLNMLDFMASLGAVQIDKQTVDTGMRLLGQTLHNLIEGGKQSQPQPQLQPQQAGMLGA